MATPNPDAHPESAAVLQPGGSGATTRRDALRWLIRAAYGAFGLAFVVPAVALRTLTRNVESVAEGDVLVLATGDTAGSPIDAASLAPGTAVQAFPEGKTEDSQNLIQLVRLADGPEGIVAYSAICTHLGCSVLPSLTDEGLIVCPCHASVFDPGADGSVRSGPAGKPLPALPVTVQEDGTVIATGPFSGDVGPD